MTAEMPPSEAPPASTATGLRSEPDSAPSRPVDDPRAAQIFATEHWSLLAGRSLAYNEAFTRAGMFLTFLSASLIVVGFLVASDRFADAVIPIVILLLAVNLFVGMATLGRIFDAGIEELAAVRGMNRIRHAYTEMIPGIQHYFIASIHDDRTGVAGVYGGGRRRLSPVVGTLHGLTTTGGMVGSIDCVLFAALIAVASLGLGAPLGLALGLSVGAFLVGLIVFTAWAYRTISRMTLFDDPMFPSPPDGPPES